MIAHCNNKFCLFNWALFLIFAQVSDVCYASDKDNIAEDQEIITSTTQDNEEVKIAPNLDLKEVAPLPKPVITKPASDEVEPETQEKTEEEVTVETEPVIDEKKYPEATAVKEKPEREKLVILGSEVPPATSTRLAWSPR